MQWNINQAKNSTRVIGCKNEYKLICHPGTRFLKHVAFGHRPRTF